MYMYRGLQPLLPNVHFAFFLPPRLLPLIGDDRSTYATRNRSLAFCTWGADGAAMCQLPKQHVVHCPVESRAKSDTVVE